MWGVKAKQPAGAIDLSQEALKDAREVIRAFIARDEPIDGGIYIDPPQSLGPFGFGILLADLVHHGAKAYAYKFGLDESEALYAISSGLAAELGYPTDIVKQIKRGAN